MMKHSFWQSLGCQTNIKAFSLKCEGLRGARKLTGENLKVVLAEFSTLSLAVFVMSAITLHRQHLEVKPRPKPSPDNLSLSMVDVFE